MKLGKIQLYLDRTEEAKNTLQLVCIIVVLVEPTCRKSRVKPVWRIKRTWWLTDDDRSIYDGGASFLILRII